MMEDNYPVDLFGNCSRIILEFDESVERSVTKHALIELQRILDHERFGIALRDLWASLDLDLKESVRAAVVRGLLYEPEIVRIAACVFAKLFNVDLAEMKAGEYIHTIFTTPTEYDDNNMAAALMAIAEIVTPQNRVIDQEHENAISEEMVKFMDDIIGFMHEITDHSIEFSIALLDAVVSILSNCMSIVKDSPLVPELMTLLPDLFPICENSDLFDRLFQILYNIAVQTYDIQEMHEVVTVDAIINLGMQGLGVNDDFLKSVMLYWNELLEWEKKRLSANIKNAAFCCEYSEKIKSSPTYLKMPPQMEYRGFGEKAAEEISDRIIEIIGVIDHEDSGPEDIENPQSCMYACSILAKLFFFNPEIILEKVKAVWEAANPEDEDWTVLHAKAIIPYVLCTNKPIKSLREFVLSVTEFLVGVILNEESVLRVVDSALYTLYQIEKTFENIRTIEQVNDLMQAFSIQQSRHPTNALRCLNLINEIIRKSNYVSKDFNAQLEEPVFKIVGEVIEFYPDNEELIRTSYLTLFLYITNSSDSVFDSMAPRISTILDDLNVLITQTLDDSINRSQSLHYTLIQTKLWLITAIFRRFHSRLSDAATITSAKLFELMHSEGTEQWHEEILTTLFDVILALPGSNLTVKETLNSYIPFSIQSGNPSLVNTAIMAVSYIFQRFGNDVSDMLDSILTTIFELLDDETYPSDEKPKMLGALSRILKGVSDSIGENRLRLLEKLDTYISMDFSTNTTDEIHFVNEMYASIYLNYSALIMKIDRNDPILCRQFYKNLINPLKKLAQLPFIDNDTIWSVLQFLHVAIPVFGRRGNIFINYHCNYYICIWGIISDEISLREYSKRVLKDIRNA
jgi:hypothetical protein